MPKHYELNEGEVHNKLTILKKDGYYVNKHGKETEIKYLCKCECGSEYHYRAYALSRGISKQCPICSAKSKRKYEQKVGDKFGKLVVISEDNFSKNQEKYRRYVLCKCECGNESVYASSRLITGKSLECKICAYKKRPQSIKHLSPLERIYKLFIPKEKHNIPCDLTIDEYSEIIKKNCAYCGSAPILKKIKGEIMYMNGVDRIDSKKPYTKDNCSPCCSRCNYAKGTLSLNDFKNQIIKIYKHLCQQEDTPQVKSDMN